MARQARFDVGEDTGTPVVEGYADKMPFKFTGTLEKVTIELKQSERTTATLSGDDALASSADQADALSGAAPRVRVKKRCTVWRADRPGNRLKEGNGHDYAHD